MIFKTSKSKKINKINRNMHVRGTALSKGSWAYPFRILRIQGWIRRKPAMDGLAGGPERIGRRPFDQSNPKFLNEETQALVSPAGDPSATLGMTAENKSMQQCRSSRWTAAMGVMTAVFAFFCVTAQASPQQTLQGLLSATNNYSANFTQTTREGRDGVSRTATGKIYLQKPNRFRWELSAPNPQIIVSDGRYLWVYDPSLMQVTQKKVTSRTFDPALLLTGDSSKILKQFRVSWLPSFGGWFQLQPKHSGSGILVIRLQYSGNQLSKIQVMNNMNQSSLFTFTQIKMNAALPANLFNFKVPQGATFLRQ